MTKKAIMIGLMMLLVVVSCGRGGGSGKTSTSNGLTVAEVADSVWNVLHMAEVELDSGIIPNEIYNKIQPGGAGCQSARHSGPTYLIEGRIDAWLNKFSEEERGLITIELLNRYENILTKELYATHPDSIDTVPRNRGIGTWVEGSDDHEPLYDEIWYADTIHRSRIIEFGRFRVDSRNIDRIDTVWPAGFVEFPEGVFNFQWNAWDDSTLWRYFICEDDTLRIYREQGHLKRR